MYQYRLRAQDIHFILNSLTVLHNINWIEVLSITRSNAENENNLHYDVFFNSRFSIAPLKGILQTIHANHSIHLSFRK
jgi:hypothetical protein